MIEHCFTIKLSLLLFLMKITMGNAATACTPCKGFQCLERASPSVLQRIELRVFGSTTNEYTTTLIERVLDLKNKLDPKKSTVIYIFGWRSKPDDEATLAIVSALLQRRGYNVIVVDWSHISMNIIYSYPALSVDGVGYYVANALKKLIAARILSLSKIECIGHSLGAQTCGFVGRYMDGKLPRITGLDPAGPGFYFVIQDLTSSDAIFVIIIHTNPGIAGTALSLGHVDFWPNGNLGLQNGCSSASCSHSRSWMYEAESIKISDAFIAVKCSSYSEFMLGLCSSNERVIMGWDTPKTASGNYYLRTNSESPFGRKINGAT